MRKLSNHRAESLPGRLSIIFLVLIGFLVIEPIKLAKVSFAVPQVDYGKSLQHQIEFDYPVEEIASSAPQQKSHAPEPSTLFLILSGLGGMLVRFAQVSFSKFKRALDLFLATVGLFITSPILLFSGLLIKLTSKGPIVYKQLRVGEKGEIFEIYKLRTMVIDAEKATGAVWAKENDPRITSIGKILRNTRVDEIPQLLNVLKGEMSIIGPRPERPEMVRDFKRLINDYEKRLLIKPGITGIAQVRHKYDDTIEDVKHKLRYDLLYVKNMRATVDLGILAQTFLVVLTGKGAR